MNKQAGLQALLYLAGDSGLSVKEAAKQLAIEPAAVRQLAEKISKKMAADRTCGLQLLFLDDEIKLTTKPALASLVQQYLGQDKGKLSQAALETLAIVAYRQPITRVEIDDIRGINSAGALQTLVLRGLVEKHGRKEVPGRPRLYQTTAYFLEYFGLQSLADLPDQDEFAADIDHPEQTEIMRSTKDE
jgi:segregation and condensation protein B